jgi:phosphate/sulfate permease
VSCGALFGIGIANGQARWKMIRTVLLAWLLTLPLSALLSAGFFWFSGSSEICHQPKNRLHPMAKACI